VWSISRGFSSGLFDSLERVFSRLRRWLKVRNSEDFGQLKESFSKPGVSIEMERGAESSVDCRGPGPPWRVAGVPDKSRT
jgi:hypothetical protein